MREIERMRAYVGVRVCVCCMCACVCVCVCVVVCARLCLPYLSTNLECFVWGFPWLQKSYLAAPSPEHTLAYAQ